MIGLNLSISNTLKIANKYINKNMNNIFYPDNGWREDQYLCIVISLEYFYHHYLKDNSKAGLALNCKKENKLNEAHVNVLVHTFCVDCLSSNVLTSEHLVFSQSLINAFNNKDLGIFSIGLSQLKQ